MSVSACEGIRLTSLARACRGLSSVSPTSFAGIICELEELLYLTRPPLHFLIPQWELPKEMAKIMVNGLNLHKLNACGMEIIRCLWHFYTTFIPLAICLFENEKATAKVLAYLPYHPPPTTPNLLSFWQSSLNEEDSADKKWITSFSAPNISPADKSAWEICSFISRENTGLEQPLRASRWKV